MNALRSTCSATYAPANTTPRLPKASGMAADMIRLMPISTSISSVTGGRSGSIQLVAQAV
jgi:hypothetical protein